MWLGLRVWVRLRSVTISERPPENTPLRWTGSLELWKEQKSCHAYKATEFCQCSNSQSAKSIHYHWTHNTKHSQTTGQPLSLSYIHTCEGCFYVHLPKTKSSCHIHHAKSTGQLPYLPNRNCEAAPTFTSYKQHTFTKYKQQDSCHIYQTETIKQLPYLSDNNTMAATFTKQKQHDSRHIYFPKTAEQISHLPNRNSNRTAAAITYQK